VAERLSDRWLRQAARCPVHATEPDFSRGAEYAAAAMRACARDYDAEHPIRSRQASRPAEEWTRTR
jgi:hypothetical protein